MKAVVTISHCMDTGGSSVSRNLCTDAELLSDMNIIMVEKADGVSIKKHTFDAYSEIHPSSLSIIPKNLLYHKWRTQKS